MKKNIVFFLLILIVLHLLILLSIRFTAWPELLSFPYLVNNGFVLYKDFVHPYPPLLTFLLTGVYKLFGYKLLVLKLFTWIVILINDILIFLIVKKLTKNIKWSLISVLAYALLQPFLEGNQLWFDLAIVPPLLYGTLFLLNKKYALAGLGFAIAALIKQTAGMYLVLGFLYLIFKKEKFKTIAAFLVPSLILGTLLGIYLATNNSLLDFLNWTLIYPFTFWSKFPGYVQMSLGNRQVMILGSLLVPLIILFLKARKYILILFIFGVSLILVYPRFSFFHFQLALAFIAILYGLALSEVKKRAYYLLFIVPLIVVLLKAPYDFGSQTRFWDSQDLAFSQKIKFKAKNNESLYLLGPHSALYVFAEALPPKPWVDNFGWYWEVPGYQEKVISSWNQNMPASIVWQDPGQGNWFDLGVYQPKMVTDWIRLNYNKREEIQPGIWLWQKK